MRPIQQVKENSAQWHLSRVDSNRLGGEGQFVTLVQMMFAEHRCARLARNQISLGSRWRAEVAVRQSEKRQNRS
jgi:hypothetical protein